MPGTLQVLALTVPCPCRHPSPWQPGLIGHQSPEVLSRLLRTTDWRWPVGQVSWQCPCCDCSCLRLALLNNIDLVQQGAHGHPYNCSVSRRRAAWHFQKSLSKDTVLISILIRNLETWKDLAHYQIAEGCRDLWQETTHYLEGWFGNGVVGRVLPLSQEVEMAKAAQ